MPEAGGDIGDEIGLGASIVSDDITLIGRIPCAIAALHARQPLKALKRRGKAACDIEAHQCLDMIPRVRNTAVKPGQRTRGELQTFDVVRGGLQMSG